MPTIERLMTFASAPAAPQLPAMPPSGRITTILEEVGLALGGVSNEAYCAFAWRWARDYVAKQQLEQHLRRAVLKLARKRRWPYRMRGELYLHKLCWLAIWEEHHWWPIRQTQAWPRLIEMDEDLWKHRVAEKYEAIRALLDIWCSEARRQATARMVDLSDLRSGGCD